MKTLSSFVKFKLSRKALEGIMGGNDYNNCRAVCYSEMAVGCESGDPSLGLGFDACMSTGYNWCDGYCGSGV